MKVPFSHIFSDPKIQGLPIGLCCFVLWKPHERLHREDGKAQQCFLSFRSGISELLHCVTCSWLLCQHWPHLGSTRFLPSMTCWNSWSPCGKLLHVHRSWSVGFSWPLLYVARRGSHRDEKTALQPAPLVLQQQGTAALQRRCGTWKTARVWWGYGLRCTGLLLENWDKLAQPRQNLVAQDSNSQVSQATVAYEFS